jgi:hypothetical protein
MRILFYNHTGIVSGAEKMLLLSLRHLPRDQYEKRDRCLPKHLLLGFRPFQVRRYRRGLLIIL